MLLGFKRRFAPFVEEGSKTHTIRAKRKIAPKVGETCHCYVDPRQKTMRLLGRWPCVKVENIQIEWLAVRNGMTILITVDDVELSRDEATLLAFRDGFRTRGLAGALDEMHDYWHILHGHEAFPFTGHLIHWTRI
jgi:hypothetical protein